MKVHLSFDVEIWCQGWDRLDQNFPAAFERYVYGRSSKGQFALPETLAILSRYGLQAVFFVEPLFSLRFGERFLKTIVDLIQAAGQDVQLHLHPEWVDEIAPPLWPEIKGKRQHLSYYSLAEQTELLKLGKRCIEACTGRPVTAFRSGSYAVNADTYLALDAAGIWVDSSLNEVYEVSGRDIVFEKRPLGPVRIGAISSYPVSVFKDGFGHLRPAQLAACSFAELRDAMESAQQLGAPNFVIVSHNFEMLRPGSSEPDLFVHRRFDRLCAYLAEHSERFTTDMYPDHTSELKPQHERATASRLATLTRYAEQLVRRLPHPAQSVA